MRNGRLPDREVLTGAGKLAVSQPRVRDKSSQVIRLELVCWHIEQETKQAKTNCLGLLLLGFKLVNPA